MYFRTMSGLAMHSSGLASPDCKTLTWLGTELLQSRVTLFQLAIKYSRSL
eukprot:CAMPEP_0177373056 /NCGR_PEP_ID=MMETSP0368-20130122/43388_1 /TAXON_ID=447022 ORGANISM="Scrippsiella hangoei-like, Strain SHHI-4" /NCGR_SAMPLE_ID=MMETSP0368 /ASSEMBLY_ACC=CAM_ASM_000363 /LENGTH=49 /DNA_ID=CAMNT_0018836495 /DNA_START=271 /DNA_END=420 /DNA_ORIENTATION=-